MWEEPMPMPFILVEDPKKRRRGERNKKHLNVIQTSEFPLPNRCSFNHPNP
jgi:hypothetical protein